MLSGALVVMTLFKYQLLKKDSYLMELVTSFKIIFSEV